MPVRLRCKSGSGLQYSSRFRSGTPGGIRGIYIPPQRSFRARYRVRIAAYRFRVPGRNSRRRVERRQRSLFFEEGRPYRTARDNARRDARIHFRRTEEKRSFGFRKQRKVILMRISKSGYYLNIAKAVALRSTCLKKQYGAAQSQSGFALCHDPGRGRRGDWQVCDQGRFL